MHHRLAFKALDPGELFLFKLHSPNNYIVGGGFFATSSLLPVSIAWETFREMNGVAEGTVGRMFADPALVRRRLGQGAFRLLRSDVHTLFDRGYVTVTPDYKFRVSRRLENDWKNGKIYYALKDREIKLPRGRFVPPAREMLEWHGDVVFLK